MGRSSAGSWPDDATVGRSVDIQSAHFSWWWISVTPLAFCAALGLVLLAIADEASRLGYGYGRCSVFFWSGLLLIFVPIAARALTRDAGRAERLSLVILLGIALYMVKVLASPQGFTFVDEYIHLRNTQDILYTQHIFGFNPLLPTAAYYPGLAAVTAALVNLTGLNTFVSGLLIMGAARMLISACLFLIAEKVTGSGRAAAAASLVYAANPMFLLWSSTFAYENLALPLAAFAVWWLGRTRAQVSWLVPMVTAISIIAVTVTHHVVGFALTALLGAWWIADRLTQRGAARQYHSIGLMALVPVRATLTWFFFVRDRQRPTSSLQYTSCLTADSVVVPWTCRPKASVQQWRLYVSQVGNRCWVRYSRPADVGPAPFTPSGLAYLVPANETGQGRHRRGRAPMAVAMGVAIAYPFTLLPRLTSDGIAISGRSSEYVFLGLGCILGLLVEESLLWRRGVARYRSRGTTLTGWRRTLAATGVVTVIFVGGVTIGTAFYQLLPEQPNPRGYPWTVQPDVINASKWAREHLGINQRFGANANDALALATYGGQLTLPENDVWPIFFAGTVNEQVVRSIRLEKIHYLMVDWRMTKGVPPSPGYYFSPQEPQDGVSKKPFPVAALRKFDTAPCIF